MASLHLAKAGGMSLGRHLQEQLSMQIPVFWHHTGRGQMHGLYWAGEFTRYECGIGDDAFDKLLLELARRHGTVIVHGHSSVEEWSRAAPGIDIEFMTWLRDPVDRIRSHFDYWRTRAPMAIAPRSSSLMDRVKAGSCSLVEFGTHESVANYVVRCLAPISIPNLSHFGILEQSQRSLERTNRYLGVQDASALPHLNQTHPGNTGRPTPLTAEDRVHIETANALDIDLYRSAVELFNS